MPKPITNLARLSTQTISNGTIVLPLARDSTAPGTDLSLVGQQHTRPSGIVLVLGARAGVFGDVHAMQGHRNRVLRCSNIAFLERNQAGSNRLDFGPSELDAARERVGYEVVVPGLAISN